MISDDDKKEQPRPARANPTEHVDYFVVDEADREVFAHAPERVSTEPPPARTAADVRELLRRTREGG